MTITLSEINDIVAGTARECDVFERVKEIIALSNELRTCVIDNTQNIGDVSQLLPSTNIVDSILALMANAPHDPASSGDDIIDVDPTTQVVTFNAQGFVDFLNNPVNSVIVDQLQTILDTDRYITDISFDPAMPNVVTYTYNDASTATFTTGISTDVGQDLSYGSDGLPYLNFSNLPVAP